MKKKSKSWIYLTIFYILLCCADGALTFYNTPDLSMEGNPLVAKIGLGWGALFLANVIGVLIFALPLRITCTYSLPVVNANGVFDWHAKLFYGENARKLWLLYKLPKNWKPFWHLFGFVCAPSLILARLILIWEWVTPRWPDWYASIRRSLPAQRADVTAGLMLMVICGVIWFVRYYRQNQKKYAEIDKKSKE